MILLLLLIGGAAFLILSDWTPLPASPQQLAREAAGSLDTPANPQDTGNRSFVVKSGESTSEIADRLQNEGLVERALVFRALAEVEGVSGDLAAGEYELSPSMKPSEILFVIAKGRTKQTPLVTIPEGWRAEQIAERLGAQGLGTAQDFVDAVKRGQSDLPVLSSRPEGASLEGYLFPDSYRFDPKLSGSAIANQMVLEFDQQFTSEMRKAAAARGLSIHQVVTLASIVEREAVLPMERPVIAGVFLNRLRDDMRLETDPTVQYAVATVVPGSREQYGWWKMDLTREDLSIDSPFNSYKYPGLPPGPICNPGLASIKAVLDPEPTEYLFFVAKPDGSHAFSKTLEEHNANVALYRK